LTHMQLDLSFVVGLVSYFMQDSHESRWKEAKHIHCYIKGTYYFCIKYTYMGFYYLVGFTYANWEDDIDDWKSTSCYTFNLGSGLVTWSNEKKHAIHLSSIVAKYEGIVNVS